MKKSRFLSVLLIFFIYNLSAGPIFIVGQNNMTYVAKYEAENWNLVENAYRDSSGVYFTGNLQHGGIRSGPINLTPGFYKLRIYAIDTGSLDSFIAELMIDNSEIDIDNYGRAYFNNEENYEEVTVSFSNYYENVTVELTLYVSGWSGGGIGHIDWMILERGELTGLIPPRVFPFPGTIEASDFVSLWNTTKLNELTSNKTQIRLPLTAEGQYNFTIFWGDGTNDTITEYNQSEVLHTYETRGIYTIVISGHLLGWRFTEKSDKIKIIEISQWGSNFNFGNSESYFSGAENLRLTATDSPDLNGTISLHKAFLGCRFLGFEGNMNSWNTSAVQDMSYMFANASTFNQPINNWDVSSVTDMNFMFSGLYRFYTYIDFWDVSSVRNMTGMFYRHRYYSQGIENWTISSVTQMDLMFYGSNIPYKTYDRMLINWANLNLQNGVIFDAGDSQFSITAQNSRKYIIDTFNWQILDGGMNEEYVTTTYRSSTDSTLEGTTNPTTNSEDGFLAWINEISELYSILGLMIVVSSGSFITFFTYRKVRNIGKIHPKSVKHHPEDAMNTIKEIIEELN